MVNASLTGYAGESCNSSTAGVRTGQGHIHIQRGASWVAITVVLVALLLTLASQVYAVSEATKLHTFTGGNDGSYPYANLVGDAAGNLYGTAQIGGVDGEGTVFKLSPESDGKWKFTVLYTFTGGVDGAQPLGSLVFDAAGNAYSTTAGGGANGQGVVFELSPSAKPGKPWDETVLYSFQGGADGALPFGGLVFDAAGNLYGTTSVGGVLHTGCAPAKGCGTIYKLSPAANGGWQETVIHRFTDAFNEGAEPLAGLVFDAAGNLYGTTYEGGNNLLCNGFGCGTVFELEPNAKGRWNLKTLIDFKVKNGALLRAGITLSGPNLLYGATLYGGLYNDGTVFSMTKNSAGHWVLGTSYSFSGLNGLHPYGRLAIDGAGNLYGTAYQGGANDSGAVFQIITNSSGWTENDLFDFSVNGSGFGFNPLDSVFLDGSGNLFLTVNQGGNLKYCQPNAGCGTVIELNSVATPSVER
jgi:uncharacterized repeat protein (TIGR03803 family)